MVAPRAPAGYTLTMNPDATSTRFAPTRITLPPWDLHNCLRALIERSIDGFPLQENQRIGYFPASPLCTIGVFYSGYSEVLSTPIDGSPGKALPAVVVTGPMSGPSCVRYSENCSGLMMGIYPDAWWILTGQPLDAITDQFLDGKDLLPAPMFDALSEMASQGRSDFNPERIDLLFRRLTPIWRDCIAQRGKGHQRWNVAPQAQTIAPWVDALALRVAATGWGRSMRQAERRMKQLAGLPLRKLQVSARGEQAFWAVVEAINDQKLDWSDIALSCGFSDQSHFIRETRRQTGFSPEALRHGLLNKEPFWMYRTLAELAGFPITPSPTHPLVPPKD
jgi:AraC-like DNA-binding protein